MEDEARVEALERQPQALQIQLAANTAQIALQATVRRDVKPDRGTNRQPN